MKLKEFLNESVKFTPELIKKIFEKTDEKLEIENAFVWEGMGAGVRVEKIEGDTIYFNLSASSTVEHDGDIAGIRSQVRELSGKKAEITLEDGMRFMATIIQSFVTSTSSEPVELDWDDEDRDHTATVKGTVVIRFEKLRKKRMAKPKLEVPNIKESTNKTCSGRCKKSILIMKIKEFLSESKKKIGHGDCYVVAGQYALDHMNEKGSFLCHGDVIGQGPVRGIKYGHAWIEKGDEIIDNSNGRQIRMPKDVYYTIGNITNVKRYTMKEACDKMVETGNYGSWE